MHPRTLVRSIALPLAFAAAALTPVFNITEARAAQSPPDCSKGGVSMMFSRAMPAVTMGGDIDHDFARTMAMHLQAMMAMERTEIACGADPKTKKFARESLEKQAQEIEQARILIGPGG